MSKKSNHANTILFCIVFGGFAMTVLALLFFGPERTFGVALFILGMMAIVFARRLANAKQAIGERLPLWPGRNTLRPMTVTLWGAGVAVVGFLMLLGLK